MAGIDDLFDDLALEKMAADSRPGVERNRQRHALAHLLGRARTAYDLAAQTRRDPKAAQQCRSSRPKTQEGRPTFDPIRFQS